MADRTHLIRLIRPDGEVATIRLEQNTDLRTMQPRWRVGMVATRGVALSTALAVHDASTLDAAIALGVKWALGIAEEDEA